MKILNLFIGLCLSVGLANAQSRVVTLAESRSAALAYSNAIKNGDIKISSAESGIIAARSNYLPNISAMGLGLYGFKDFVPPIPNLLDDGINNVYTLGVTATQSIYAGGKIANSNRLAELRLLANRLLARQSLDSVLLVTEQKYWTIVHLQEQQKTIKANEALLNGVLKTQSDMLSAGLIARNDRLKTQVQLSQLQVNKSKVNNMRMLALFDFSLYTGLTYDSLMVMQDTLNKSAMPSLQATGPDTTLHQLNGFKLLELDVKSRELQTSLEKGNNLPAFSVGLSAAQVGSFNGAFESKLTPVAFGMLSIPISGNLWGTNRQTVKQKKLNEQIAKNNLQDGRDKLQVGIMRYWYDLKDAITQIQYAKDNLVQATENLKVSQDNYKAGLNTVVDVLDAQANYQQAETTLNTAFSDFEIKKANYRWVTGTIANN